MTEKMPGVRPWAAALRGLLIPVVLVFAAACGGDDSTAPTDKPDPVPAGIKIQNNSAFTIVDVYYSSCSATSFGSDRLGGAIAPGSSQTFTDGVSAGCYDVLVVTDTGAQATFRGQQIAAEGATTVTVTN
jgi:hypothetical protein